MRARITVTLKNGVLDPQGKAIEGALRSLGIEGIGAVRQGKIFDVELDGLARGQADAALHLACERLLANTVVENYRIDLDGGEDASGPEEAAGGADEADLPGEDETAPFETLG